jgi:putative ABC transport system permease protein
MFAIDLLQETAAALIGNKARTALTILGIVIGIASVIAMVAIGQGTSNSIETSIGGLGSNLLTVMPGGGQSGRGQISAGRGNMQTLTVDDAEAMRGLAGVAAVSPESSSRKQVTSPLGNNTNTTIMGALPDYLAVHNVEVATGSFISEAGVAGANRVAVLGATAATDLFGEDGDPIGETIRINRMSFKIIGVLAAKGGSGMSNVDDMVVIPLTTMLQTMTGGQYVSSVAVSAESRGAMVAVKQSITDLLLGRHDVEAENPDFSVMSMDDVLTAVSSVTGTFTAFLAAIAGISLIVGGIGIMNMMLTTVTERTREIGLRKALGAKRADISRQFLSEAVLLTFIGGAVGVAVGAGAAAVVARVMSVTTEVTPEAVFLAIGVCAAIGILFGYYPARRAAALHPIEALRHE